MLFRSYIEGKIRTRSYDDKDGNKRYVTEIVADLMQMLGKKSDSGTEENHDRSIESQKNNSGRQENFVSGSNQGGQSPDTFDNTRSSDDDDLPF